MPAVPMDVLPLLGGWAARKDGDVVTAFLKMTSQHPSHLPASTGNHNAQRTCGRKGAVDHYPEFNSTNRYAAGGAGGRGIGGTP